MSDKPQPAPRGTETDVQQFLADLYGGAFEKKVGHALSVVAAGVVEHSRKGKVVITFDVARIGESQTVNIGHTVAMDAPTMRGNRTEKDKTETPMHVNRGGRLTLFPENQSRMEFDSFTFTPEGQKA